MKFIDLSLTINPDTLVYPGDPPVKLEPVGMLGNDGWIDHLLTIGTHAGTHVDAPMHMVENGKSLDKFPLSRFTGRGRLVALKNRQFDLSQFEKADIKEGDIVLVYTGVSDVYPSPEYLENYPAMPEEIAQYLVDKRVSMVGVDTSSVDHEEFVAHKLLLENEVLIIENLTNLGALSGKDFTVHAFPLALQVDGAPTRVVAVVND